MNVVFDLGGVVFNWKPYELIKKIFKDKNNQKKANSKILHHRDWAKLDRGAINKDDAVKRAVIRTGLPAKKIDELFDTVPSSLTPIMETVDLIYKVKQFNNKVFVLSNMPFSTIEYLETKNTFWDIFDGKIISCRVQLVKPELKIYRYLLNEYGLKPDESIFIDDTEINLKPASTIGMKTILFKNPRQCEKQLDIYGVFDNS